MAESAGGPARGPHDWTRDVFLRLLGAVYCAAFLSLWVQIEGLIGSRGLLPVRELLDLARERLDSTRYVVLPTVFWLSDADVALQVVCAMGLARPWLLRLFQRLLEGSPPVLGLLGHDPFGGRPPFYVRALVYDYRFADPAAHRSTGQWWTRRLVGEFCPAVSLRPGSEP